jgi:hypothetical protein
MLSRSIQIPISEFKKIKKGHPNILDGLLKETYIAN